MTDRLGRLAVPADERPRAPRSGIPGPRPASEPMDLARRDQLLGDLEVARDDLAVAENRVHTTAVAARLAGATWNQLGRVLGMTAKSAWKRYCRP